MTARRMVAIVVGSALVVGAGITLLVSTVTTSTAQLSASTTGDGFFAAGTVELDQPETKVSLLFDANGLYPGRIVSSCVTLAYQGSLPADIRLHAARSAGTGLEDHVELRLTDRASGSCPEDGTDADVDVGDRATGPIDGGRPIFLGLLGDLWRTHPQYADGLVLRARAENGDRLVIEAEVEMVGGDEAQGLSTEFTIIIEARP